MYVVNCGWIGWFAKIRFSRSPIFKLCVSQTLLKWLTCYSLPTISSRGSIQNILVASSGWIGWIANPRKNNFSRNSIFKKYVCRNCWLNWLNRQFSPNNTSRNSIFENMYVVTACWIGWLVQSSQLICWDTLFFDPPNNIFFWGEGKHSDKFSRHFRQF